VKYANALSEAALAKLYNGQIDESVIEDFEDAKEIIFNSLGTYSIEYSKILRNIGFYQLETGRNREAKRNLNTSLDILKELGTKNYKLTLAQNYQLLGKVQMFTEDYGRSEASFKKSLSYYKDIFNDENHIETVQTKSSLARLYYVIGERKDSKKTLNNTTEIYLEYINRYFNYLTEREKQQFWKKIKTDFEFFNTIAFENNDPKEVERVYNNTLNTKALLLQSSKQLRKSILASNDKNVAELFNTWTAKQSLLTKYIAYSNEDLEKEGIELEVLQKEVDKLEKELGTKSNAFAEDKKSKNITWKDVRDNLEENEYAVEIIRYRSFDKSFTNEIIYKALVISKDSETPQVVDIKNGTDLDKKYLTFYRNATKFRSRDPYSYKAFFESIHEVVGKGSKIYISLDGVYNLINIETLRMPDGRFVIDENEIIVLSNTKEIVTKIKNVRANKNPNKNVLLIGNPMYYATNINSSDHSNYEESQQVIQLPGAEQEVLALHNSFESNNWNADVFIWDKADESLITSFDTTKDYSYIHISTHGFFKSSSTTKSITENLDDRRGLEDPYLRAGLIFKNGGDIMDENNILNYNVSDGILTAKEVSNLNLEKVNTIVLSACETGLGKVSSGEGVYGLQRAFQIAGVETIVISLFKVDDRITKLFMEKMTDKYLETQNSREALQFAKNEVRQLYPDPIYWGSFVMVE